MNKNVFEPLKLNAYYYLWDLATNINDIAVLYRKSIAQSDNFQGRVPQKPDMSGYVPGTNALIFGPQGGLRISALDMAKLQQMIYHEGTLGNVTILQPETILTMRTTNWLYNGTNGDTDLDLFHAWGIATQIITGTKGKDMVFPDSVMFGHAGDAYGLISDNFLDPLTGYGVIFMTNGPKNSQYFPYSKKSAFYVPEADTFEVLDKYSRTKCL